MSKQTIRVSKSIVVGGETINITFKEERVDDRKNKKYEMVAEVTVYGENGSSVVHDGRDTIVTRVKAMGGVADLASIEVRAVKWSGWACFRATRTFTRPSDIVGFDQAWLESVSDIVAAVVRENHAVNEQRQKAEVLIRQVQHVAAKIANEAERRAREGIGFEAKLAALYAELHTATMETLKQVVQDINPHDAAEKGVSEPVLRSAIKHAPEFVREGGGDLMFPRSAPQIAIDPSEFN
jgi:hypothetical protein